MKRRPRRKIVGVELTRQRRADIFEAVGQNEGERLHRGRARLLHVVAGSRSIESRHVPGGLFDNVGDDPHRRTGWVDMSIPNHEFFSECRSDRAGKLVLRHALLLNRDNIGGIEGDRILADVFRGRVDGSPSTVRLI
jgi:hypothetical protein